MQFTWWILPSLIGATVSAATLEWLIRRRRDHGALTLCVMAGAVLWWCLTQAAGLLVTSPGATTRIWQFQYIGISAAPLAWFAFALVYSGRSQVLRAWTMIPVYGLTAATVALAFTNTRHGLLWAELIPETLPNGYVGLLIEHGLWFRVNLGMAYALAALATGVLGLHIAQSPRHWYKLSYVIGAPVVVLLPSLVYLTPLQPMGWVDLTPLGFALSSGVLAFGLVREGAAGFAPVARTAVVEEMADIVVVVDEQHRIVDVNRAARETLGLRVSGPVPIELGTSWAMTRGEPGEDRKPAQLHLRTMQGTERDFEMRYARLGPQAGKGRSVVVLRDISERLAIEKELRETKRQLEDSNHELERRANTDGLTALANRRLFIETLEREIERAQRYQRPLSLVMLDLDHFKAVNDTYGHAAGDSVLRAAAAALNRVSRDTDLPARIGGEELALVLPETHVEGAAQVAERLRTLIAAERHLAPHGTDFSVTASFGVASHLGQEGTAAELMQRADEALYRSKDLGRDRVTIADPPIQKRA